MLIISLIYNTQLEILYTNVKGEIWDEWSVRGEAAQTELNSSFVAMTSQITMYDIL